MAVILLETAVGGAVVLWAGGVWGKVRRGFFLLVGITLALCAAGAWAIVSGALSGPAVTAIAVFTGLLVVWQVLLALRQDRLSRFVGLAAAIAGVVTLPLFAEATRDAGVARGIAELVLGSVFLGTAVYGLLLGHWYLVDRRLDKRYMVKGAWFYVAGVVAAAGAAALAALNPPTRGHLADLPVPRHPVVHRPAGRRPGGDLRPDRRVRDQARQRGRPLHPGRDRLLLPRRHHGLLRGAGFEVQVLHVTWRAHSRARGGAL